MSIHTRRQKLAQAAFARIAAHGLPSPDPAPRVPRSGAGGEGKSDGLSSSSGRGEGKLDQEYVSFVKKFPALIHTCGLAQAVAFALAKKEIGYVEDLAAVLKNSGYPEITSAPALEEQTRTQQLSGYLRLSRDALHAASWLKRYAEATAGEGE